MNKVITINLNGAAYQLEEGGYEALRAYLEGATRRLEGNPDRDEIIADIEQAIGEKCRALLGSFKTVVTAKEVEQIIAEMGPVEDASDENAQGSTGASAQAKPAGTDAGANPGPAASADEPRAGRRLFRIYPEGAMLSGVCNGLAAYFNIDVTIIRVAFVLLAFLSFGAIALAYLIMVIVVPRARTPDEKAAAFGTPFTAQEFIRRAREGYYEGVKTFSDKRAHREWRRRFKEEMRSWRRTWKGEARACRNDWHGYGDYWHPGTAAGAWFALPLFAAIRAGLFLLWAAAFVSLMATGHVFGIAPPDGLPVWGTALLLFFIYCFVAWPLKILRYASWRDAQASSPWAPALLGVGYFVVWGAFAVTAAWLVTHHMAEIQDAIKNIPTHFHQAIDAFRDWWQKK